jgi:hypothetical protein
MLLLHNDGVDVGRQKAVHFQISAGREKTLGVCGEGNEPAHKRVLELALRDSRLHLSVRAEGTRAVKAAGLCFVNEHI